MSAARAPPWAGHAGALLGSRERAGRGREVAGAAESGAQGVPGPGRSPGPTRVPLGKSWGGAQGSLGRAGPPPCCPPGVQGLRGRPEEHRQRLDRDSGRQHPLPRPERHGSEEAELCRRLGHGLPRSGVGWGEHALGVPPVPRHSELAKTREGELQRAGAPRGEGRTESEPDLLGGGGILGLQGDRVPRM